MRRGHSKSIAGVLLAVGSLMLFGCGGGESGSSLSKAEFIKKVNQACSVENEERVHAKAEKLKELKLEPGEIASASQHQEIVEVTLAPYEKMTERLKELVPSDQEETLEPLIAARENVAKAVREDEVVATDSLVAIKKANDLAKEFGLKGCST